ncbi:MAG: Holliday junction branch migration protein RuvA [Gammaproteobacteria bacterium HGW-Gammaproteobacteria-8]|nr:MAG: Holliday junction branch migration protein RuvA [Gammaproteobacteria bacterium HGW-Gammaproteobacteria-8]
MIARLSGTLVERQPPWLVIEAGGVGYEVEAPLSVFDRLPQTGEPATLLIHQVVREDALLLFGFATRQDRELFRSLLKVSGVGPKVALAILSSVSAGDFALLVESGDSQALTRLPGIGKKTAERLVLEMRSRLDGLDLGAGSAGRGGPSGPADAGAEARAGLVALGYSPAEALKMTRGVAAEDASAEAIIRAALKNRMQRP